MLSVVYMSDPWVAARVARFEINRDGATGYKKPQLNFGGKQK